VRETWGVYTEDWNDTDRFLYRADYPNGEKGYWHEPEHINWCDLPTWRPSIFMPKEAARLFIKIIGVRAERLQDITVEDVIKEGHPAENEIRNPDPTTHESIRNWNHAYAQHLFSKLWDSIYAKPKPQYIKVDGKKRIDSYISYPWEDIHETRTWRGKPWYVAGNPWVWSFEFERTEKSDG
jgi:hypothetical protein